MNSYPECEHSQHLSLCLSLLLLRAVTPFSSLNAKLRLRLLAIIITFFPFIYPLYTSSIDWTLYTID